MTQEMETGFPWQRQLTHGSVPRVLLLAVFRDAGAGLVAPPTPPISERRGDACQDCVHSVGIRSSHCLSYFSSAAVLCCVYDCIVNCYLNRCCSLCVWLIITEVQ